MADSQCGGSSVAQESAYDKATVASAASLLDHIATGVLGVRGGAIVYANRAALRLLGACSPQALLGREFAALVSTDQAPGLAAALAACAEGGTGRVRLEVRVAGAAGNVDVLLEIERVPETDPPLVSVTLADLREDRRAQRALRESEERYRALVESSPDAVYVQVEGLIVYANRAAAALLGVADPEALVGRHVVDHVHPEYRRLVQHRIHQAASHGFLEPRVLERLRTYDGRDLWVQIQGSFVTYGARQGVQVILRDVTEQVALEEALRRQRALYAQVVESAPEAALVVDGGAIRYANASALRLLSYPALERLHGTRFLDHMAPEAEPVVVAALSAAGEGRLPPVQETRARRSDGTFVEVALRVTPMPYETEHLAQVTLYDLTERKEHEAALLRRDAILGAVAYAAERFLRESTWHDCIQEVLGRIGQAAEAARVYLYQSTAGAEGVQATLQALWPAPAATRPGLPAVPAAWRIASERDAEWHAALAAGEVVSAPRRERAGAAGPAGEPCASLLVPVHVDGRLWGAIGCDDPRTDRQWTGVERDALRSAASILGAAIQRQNAVDALARTEQRLREVLDRSRDVIYRLDAPRRAFDYVSAASEHLLGVSSLVLVQSSPEAFLGSIHPDDRAEFLRAVEGLLASAASAPSPPPAEYRWRHPDGSYRWLSDYRTVVRDAEGRVAALVGTVRDMTPQVEARLALAQSEERFRSVFEGTRDAIVVQDRAHRVLYANAAALAWMRRTPQQLLGRTPDVVLRGDLDIVDRWSAAVDRVAAARERIEGSTGYTLRGERHFVEYAILPLTDENGVYAVASSVHDVTARQRAELALRESEARARVLFESIGDGFLLFGPEFRVVDSNEVARDMLGAAGETLAGMGADEVAAGLGLSPADLRRLLGEAAARGTPLHHAGSQPVLGAGDEAAARYLDLLAYAVQVRGERRLAVLARDVTASRRLAAALERSRQLEAIGRLSAGVAHDFGNLLSVIQGECELLESRLAIDPEALQELRAIESVTESGVSVTRELMAFSTGENVEREILHLGMVVRSNEAILRRLAGPSVRVELDLDPGPLYVWGQAGQLGRVLANLTLNARDAMPDGGVLRIATCALDAPPAAMQHAVLAEGPYALLTVSDSGRGISEEDLAHVFEPYYTTRPGQGRHGLGLSVVYGIVIQSGGDIAVTSRRDQGTTFSVILPAVPLPDDEDALP